VGAVRRGAQQQHSASETAVPAKPRRHSASKTAQCLRTRAVPANPRRHRANPRRHGTRLKLAPRAPLPPVTNTGGSGPSSSAYASTSWPSSAEASGSRAIVEAGGCH
jgi:hypothetical protein